MIPSVIAYARLIWAAAGKRALRGVGSTACLSVLHHVAAKSSSGRILRYASLMASAIKPLAGGDPKHAAILAAILALATGVLLLLASRLKLGRAADFLSKPVLVGYMTGAALILVGSQLSSSARREEAGQERDFSPRLVEAFRTRCTRRTCPRCFLDWDCWR